LMGSNYVFHTTPLARVNGLALLFAVAGLACCAAWDRGFKEPASLRPALGQFWPLRWRPPSVESQQSRAVRWGWLGGAALCFLLALYTKQTTVDAVGAGLLAIALRDLRAGVVVGLVVGVLGGIGLLILN